MNVVKNFGQNFSNEVGSALHLKSSKDNQHPVAKGADGKKSNRISVDVDNAYKAFAEFQVNLKHLATLYKTEHELMKSLNENGLYTAKCYQKMLSNSPLQLIVTTEIAEDDTTDASPNKKKHLDPEGSPVHKAQSKEYEKGEFVTAGLSKSESIDVDNDDDQHESYLRNIEPEEVLEEQDYKFTKKRTESSFVANPPKQTVTEKKEDPPSKSSLLKKQEDFDDQPRPYKDEETGDQQVAHDHSDSEFPNDEKPGDDIENDNVQKEGLNVMVNVIDDSDDSFTDQVIHDDDSFADDNGVAVKEAEAGVDADNDADVTKDSHTGDETNEVNERSPMDPDGEVLETTNGEKDNDQEPELNDKKESDGATEEEEKLDFCDVEIADNVEPSAPELNKMLESPVVVDDENGVSYYQVHKQVYKETNSYLKKHSKLVDYVEDWEKTVTTRVQSMHSEYQKLRKGTLQTILIITYFAQALTIILFIPGLNHYTFKVDSLQAEKRKSEEKNRDMPPKRLEKLERNRTKLMGTRKSHDAAGVDLIILIDEIVNRCWKDAFPLLHNSANFETEFSAMQAKVYSSLSSTLVMLDQVSRKESVLPSDNRLLSLASSSPEELNFYKFKGDWD